MSARTLTAITGMLALLVLALPASSQEQPATQDIIEKYFWVDTANVVSIDEKQGKLTVTDAQGPETYVVDDTTLIREGSDTVSLGALSPGDRLAISAHVGQDAVADMPIADTITVVITNPGNGEPVKRKKRQ